MPLLFQGDLSLTSPQKTLFQIKGEPHAGHTIKNNPDFNIRRSILQKFIHRVEIGVDSIKIYWNLDKDYYEQELKIKNPEKNRGFIGCLIQVRILVRIA